MALTKIQKIGVAGVCIFFYGVLFATVILPAVVEFALKRKIALKSGWWRREIVWSKFPFVIDFHFYFFNVTNPDGIKNGEKPVLQQVGPFIYDQIHEKTNQVDREEDDTVEFTVRNTFYFSPEKSNGLTGDEEIVVPHYFILGVLNTLMRVKPTAIPIFGKAMDSIFKKPDNIFVRAKVKDILFGGLPIDCGVKDFAGSAICNEIKPVYEDLGLKKVDEDVYLMSLWSAMNGSDSKGATRVYRGLRDIMDVGRVMEYAGKPNMSVWNDEHCDRFMGTDGTILPPHLDVRGPIAIYSAGLCRNLFLHYESKTKFDGISLSRFTLDLGTDGENEPLQRCYCPAAPEGCLKRGVYDAFECLNMPLIVSNPHFYLADPYYAGLVDGLNPVKEEHMVIVDLDTFSGSGVYARTRAQFNMRIFRVEKYKIMRNFPEALLPLFWIDAKMIVSDFLRRDLRFGLMLYNVAIVFQYLVIAAGLGMCGYAGFIRYKAVREKKTMKAPASSAKSNDAEKELPINNIPSAKVLAAVKNNLFYV